MTQTFNDWCDVEIPILRIRRGWFVAFASPFILLSPVRIYSYTKYMGWW